MESQNHVGSSLTDRSVDARCHARYQLNVDIKIYSRTAGLLLGKTIDISEGGLSALLKIEAPLNEIVHLEFRLPLGFVAVRAVVRHRNAFRFGFQFFEPDPRTQEIIKGVILQAVSLHSWCG
jgi:c-di-GMP-binding flagellar brake protein YcgR